MENLLLKEFDFHNSYNSMMLRNEYCKKYSWAIPNEHSLNEIKKHAPVVEIGAGSGYWAKLLQDMGVDIIPYDISPPDSAERNTYHNKDTWTHVNLGGTYKIKKHQDRTLMLCWPPYETSMAHDTLSMYEGFTIIFIGESGGGCTGDDKFFSLLEKEFVETNIIQIPQWTGIHDYMYIYKRK